MSIPCKLSGTFLSSDTISGTFVDSIKLKGVFRAETKTVIGVIEATVSTEIESNPVSLGEFEEVVTTENLVEGKTYHVICSGIVQAKGEADLMFSWRLYDQTNDVELPQSKTKRQMTGTDNQEPYYYVGRFTAGATTGGLQFQQRGNVPYDTAITQYLSLLLLDMSEIDDANYFFETFGYLSQLTGDWVDLATHTIEDPPAGEKWLVFGHVMSHINSLSMRTELRMVQREKDVVEDLSDTPHISYVGNNTDDELGWWIARAYTFDSSPPTLKNQSFTLQARNVGTGANGYAFVSNLFGIKLDGSTQFYDQFKSPIEETTDTNFTNIGTNNYTPIYTEKVLAVSYATFPANNDREQGFTIIQKDNTTIPNHAPDIYPLITTGYGDDILPLSYMTVFDGVKDTEYNMRQGVRSIGAGIEFVDTSFVILSTEFGTRTPVTPVYILGEFDDRIIKIKGSFGTQELLRGLSDVQKLRGVFSPSIDTLLGHSDKIKIEGVLTNSSIIANILGLFDNQIKKKGQFETAISISGDFTCVPTAAVCTAYNLDFHYTCNSAHIVSAGF